MIVTRGLGLGGSRKGALVSYGLGRNYVFTSEYVASVPSWALTLGSYFPATVTTGSVFLFLPTRNLSVSSEVSAFKTDNFKTNQNAVDLFLGNIGISSRITDNIWSNPRVLNLNLEGLDPQVSTTTKYLGSIPTNYSYLSPNPPFIDAVPTGSFFASNIGTTLSITGYSSVIITKNYVGRILASPLHLSSNAPEYGWSYSGVVGPAFLQLVANVANLAEPIRNRLQLNAQSNDLNVIHTAITSISSSTKINKEEVSTSNITPILINPQSNKADIISLRNNSKILSSSKPTRIDIR